jgi:hypothetical protein
MAKKVLEIEIEIEIVEFDVFIPFFYMATLFSK